MSKIVPLIKAPWEPLSHLPATSDMFERYTVVGWGPNTGTCVVTVTNFKGNLHGSAGSYHGCAFADCGVDRFMLDPAPKREA